MQGRIWIAAVRARPAAWIFLAVFLVLGWKVVHARLRAVPVALVQSAAGRVVVIDPGHGGADPGAVAASGLLEKDVTLAIALHLERLLQGAGVHVVLTRRDDTDLADPHAAVRKTQDLTRRVAVARGGADLFVSLHANSSPSPLWSGAQTFYSPGRAPDRRLAERIQARLVSLLGPNRRRAAAADYYVLRESPVPAALVEVGFLSHPEESARLGSPAYQRRVAEAIYLGILDYFSE
ncbi:MAG: hypothetical protein GX161_09550 [Firmicutes bacterium]|jgi:N-acetylmuramoyl-L-alanine amidase|nr:hypothetical protein [Bacillota bacterium]